MQPKDIEPRLTTLAKRLNTESSDNKIRRLVSLIRDATHPNKMESTTDNRRKRTLTDGQDITIPKQHVEELRAELREIRDELDNISEETDRMNPERLSKSLNRVNESIFGAKDDFEFALFSRNQLRFYENVVDINHSVSVNDSDIEQLEECLDDILDECSYVSQNLRSISVPSTETIQKEADEARAEQARRQAEEMLQYREESQSTFGD